MAALAGKPLMLNPTELYLRAGLQGPLQVMDLQAPLLHFSKAA